MHTTTAAAVRVHGIIVMGPEYINGCTLLGFLVLRSAAMTATLPWTSVGVATGYRGNPRVSTARATAHGAFTANATVGHGTCRGSVSGKLRGTKHGNPRKSAAIATAISADVKPQQFPRPSAVVLDTRQLPRKSTAIELPR